MAASVRLSRNPPAPFRAWWRPARRSRRIWREGAVPGAQRTTRCAADPGPSLKLGLCNGPGSASRDFIPRRVRDKSQEDARNAAMNIHEYQAKAALREFGVPVPPGIPAFTVDAAVKAAQELGGPVWVVKAQIHAGGPGN